MLAGLWRWTAQAAAPIVAAARTVTPRDRHTWTTPGRAYIEARGVHLPGNAEARKQIQDFLARCDGVRWAEINCAVGRVVLEYDPALTSLSQLHDAVRQAEVDAGVSGEPFSGVPHPTDPWRVLCNAVVVGANLGGLGYVTATRLLPVPALPASVPAALATADSAAQVREALAAGIGEPATDLLFGVTRAVAGALAQSPVNLVTDAAHRYTEFREASAVRRGWTRWDAQFGARPENHRCEPLRVHPRPRSVPSGPVEWETGTSVLAGPAAFAAFSVPSFQRAQGFLVSGVPRGAIIGRGGFAAALGHGLCERGTVLLDPRALRRLDRVDTVVVDTSLLRTGKWVVQDVVALDARADTARLWERAYDLVTSGSQERAGWRLSPVAGDTRLPMSLRDAADRGSTVLALGWGASTVALVEVEEELDPLAGELLDAARAVGQVLLAGEDLHGHRRFDQVLPIDGLAGQVRELQRDGACVAVVSSSQREALAAADIGLGVARSGGQPWGADLITGASLGESCVLLRTVPLARKVSTRCSQITMVGSATAALLAAFGPASTSQNRAAVPVSTASGFAFAAGLWWGLMAASGPVPRAVPRPPWHGMTASRVLEALDSSPMGLPDSVASERVRESLPGTGTPSLAQASLEELATPLTPALAIGAAVSAGIGAVADAVLIGGVLGVNALIGGVQRYNAERSMGQLLAVSTLPVGLLRAGKRLRAPATDLVVGDVIELVAGDSVPADCRLLEADGVEADESSLTGESQLVPKSPDATPAAAVPDRACMVYQGTAIAAGRALAVVVAVGPDTEASAAVPLGPQGRQGGVAARLQSLAKVMVPLSLGSGVLLFVADLLRRQPFPAALGRAVGMAVAAVPEGLPFVATVAEIAAARRLSGRGAMVRDSSTIEALGRANVLCFDKTGTLTEGRIALRRVSDGVDDRHVADLSTVERGVLAAALRASPLSDGDNLLPHPTDQAVVDGAQYAQVNAVEGRTGWRPIDEMPFEPSRGYHAVLGGSAEGNLLSVKGAPEIVLAQCTHWQRPDGDLPFDEVGRAKVMAEFERLARQGYRVLAVAERPASDRRDLDESRIERLRLRGLLALADPVRPTAAAAVSQLQRAGVEIVMITGDHPSTAEAIAAELGALNGREVMIGTELDALRDDELLDRVGNVAVFARATPTQKARIVWALQRIGRVVAVTGDGANDAPAIRLADVGIALGERATPAAREAADVVVLDNRIETIVDAIVEGRAMWASVRDALALLLGGNLGEIGSTIATGLISPAGSLNARQLLLINMLTDVLPAMAIAVRPPPRLTPEMLLAEGPETSLGSALIRDILKRGAVTAAAATAAWILGRATGTVQHANSVTLVTVVVSQLGQTLALRGRTPLVVVGALASLGVLVVLVQVPVVSHFFGSTPLWPHGWAIALGTSAVATVVSVILG